MKFKKVLTFLLAIMMIFSSIPIISVSAETKETANNYNLHKDLVFDYEPPVGDKATKDFIKLLESFSVEKKHVYKDKEGVKYEFSFSGGFMDLTGIMVPSTIQEYTLPATVTLYYFVAATGSPESGVYTTDKEGIHIGWDMPIGVLLQKREVEINAIDTEILGSIDAEKIVLSKNITRIQKGSFNTDISQKLKEIYAPSVAIVGEKAFLCCSSLEKVYMPSLKRIDAYGFSECYSLKDFTYGNLSFIGKYAFSFCSSLKNISLPKTVTYLQDYAFEGCTTLESIEIPTGIQLNTLPKGCFQSCTSLKEITLPYEIIIISESTFSGCSNLKVVNFINTNVSTISKNAFFGCLRLETVYLPQSLVSIVPSSFESCPNLRFVYFASSLTDAQKAAFEKAEFGAKIITEKDEKAPVINITEKNELKVAPEEISAPPTTLTITDELDVISVTVMHNNKEIPAEQKVLQVNSYSTIGWTVLLKEDGDYKITAMDAVGNKTVKTIKYTNTEYIITPNDVAVALDKTYEELPVYPEVKVIKNGKTLTDTKDYKVEYFNTDKEGEGKVVITGIAPYNGTVTVNFEIKKISFIKGDLNKDGKVSASDARMALRISAQLDPCDDEIIKIADMNEDGNITSSDARKILRISAMLE